MLNTSAKRAFVVALLAAMAVGVLGATTCPSQTFVNKLCSSGLATWANGLLKPANSTNMPGVIGGHLLCSDSQTYIYRAGNTTGQVTTVLDILYGPKPQGQGCTRKIGQVNKPIIYCCPVAGGKTVQVYFTVAALDLRPGCTVNGPLYCDKSAFNAFYVAGG
jgi:hypothetical protein